MIDLETTVETAKLCGLLGGVILGNLAVATTATYAVLMTGFSAYQGHKHTFGLKSATDGVKFAWEMMAKVDIINLNNPAEIDKQCQPIYRKYGLAMPQPIG